MECITCKTKMVCENDVVESHTRIDFLKCPKCGSEADVVMHPRENYIKEVNWRR